MMGRIVCIRDTGLHVIVATCSCQPLPVATGRLRRDFDESHTARAPELGSALACAREVPVVLRYQRQRWP